MYILQILYIIENNNLQEKIGGMMKVGMIWRKFKISPLALNSKNFKLAREGESKAQKGNEKRGIVSQAY